MNYQLFILPRAQKNLAKLPKGIYERTRDSLHDLSEEPRPIGSKKLVGRDGWRIRIGNYRAIYEINDNAKTVTILDIKHRREIYR